MGIYLWRDLPIPDDILCFTAGQSNSTITLTKGTSLPVLNLETSSDWLTWSDYTISPSATITLANEWDKIYMRNKSETPTWFCTGTSRQYKYHFSMTWKIAASWDIGYLLCKNGTDTVYDFTFYEVFKNCSALTSAPSLSATTLGILCYMYMFQNCTSLTTLPALPATTLTRYCYSQMFNWCTSIKVSATQGGDYTQEYRIPTTWTWTIGESSLESMFYGTWGTFTGNPTINTTYYTSNTIV